MTGRKYKNMITSTYDWKINTKEPDAGFFKLAKEHGLAETAAKIAYERGITTEEALEDFLKADLSHLHDPYLLHDIELFDIPVATFDIHPHFLFVKQYF